MAWTGFCGELQVVGVFLVQGLVPGKEGFRHLGKRRGPWERGSGGWMLACFTTDRPGFKF